MKTYNEYNTGLSDFYIDAFFDEFIEGKQQCTFAEFTTGLDAQATTILGNNYDQNNDISEKFHALIQTTMATLDFEGAPLEKLFTRKELAEAWPNW